MQRVAVFFYTYQWISCLSSIVQHSETSGREKAGAVLFGYGRRHLPIYWLEATEFSEQSRMLFPWRVVGIKADC